MKCQRCSEKEAKVTVSRLVAGQPVLENLCAECARVLEKPELLTLFSEEGLLHHMMDVMEDSALKIEYVVTQRCPNCGLTYAGYKKIRKLGCGVCYTTFEEKLMDWIRRFQGADYHIGMRPGAVELENQQMGQMLLNALKEAVEREDFEMAASLRDKIKGLEAIKYGK